jgi:predicted RNA-binding protein (virulence factor B family)
MATIGKRNTLAIVRASGPGLYLDGGELGEILLPGRYIPKDIAPKQLLNVFIYLDSEDRLVATTETPLAEVGEFAALKVVGVNRNVGAFLNWGLPKDLLLPFREQDKPLRIGQNVVVYVYLDPQSKRIAASARLARYLSKEPPEYAKNQPVNLLITSRSTLGYNAIIENAHRGLLYHDRVHTPLEIGQKLKGFVTEVRLDGRIDLSLDAGGYKRIAPLTTQILDRLRAAGGKLPFDDSTPPEKIRADFNTSKKSFKQALGALYKKRLIRFEPSGGIALAENTSFAPSREPAPRTRRTFRGS